MTEYTFLNREVGERLCQFYGLTMGQEITFGTIEQVDNIVVEGANCMGKTTKCNVSCDQRDALSSRAENDAKMSKLFEQFMATKHNTTIDRWPLLSNQIYEFVYANYDTFKYADLEKLETQFDLKPVIEYLSTHTTLGVLIACDHVGNIMARAIERNNGTDIYDPRFFQLINNCFLYVAAILEKKFYRRVMYVHGSIERISNIIDRLRSPRSCSKVCVNGPICETLFNRAIENGWDIDGFPFKANLNNIYDMMTRIHRLMELHDIQLYVLISTDRERHESNMIWFKIYTSLELLFHNRVKLVQKNRVLQPVLGSAVHPLPILEQHFPPQEFIDLTVRAPSPMPRLIGSNPVPLRLEASVFAVHRPTMPYGDFPTPDPNGKPHSMYGGLTN